MGFIFWGSWISVRDDKSGGPADVVFSSLSMLWKLSMLSSSLSTVATAALLFWTEGQTSPPVYYSVQLPWQPAPSPLSGDESEQRDCRERLLLLCFTFMSLCSLLTFVLFFFFSLFDLWPLKCMTVGITEEWSCRVNSRCCDYASDSPVSRGGQVWDEQTVFRLRARIERRSQLGCGVFTSCLSKLGLFPMFITA